MKKFKTILMTLLALVIAGSGLLVAQQTTAKIIGTVQLEDGALLPGVKVEATSPSLVGKTSGVSDENGAFRLAGLTPGVYKLVFSLEGFNTVVRENIPLALEQTITLKITMQTGTIDNAITVTGQVPLIDVKSTAKGMTLNKDVFEVLPKGRNFDTLTAIIPGVTNEKFLGVNQIDGSYAVGISVEGASGGENMYYLDGQNVNTVYGGGGAQSAAFEFVDEVQVKASGYQAEFGGSLGGVINVVTRSGGNEFHGEVVGYYSGSALRGMERDTVILDPSTNVPTMLRFNYDSDRGQGYTDSRLEGGFGVGGYIIKDKVWFYANALPVLSNSTRRVIFLYPSTSQYIASDPANNVFNVYDFDQTYNFLNFQGKLSAQPAKNLRLSASAVVNYSVWDGWSPASGGHPLRSGGSFDGVDWSAQGYGYPNYSFSGNFDYTIGNNFMITGRVGYFFLGVSNKLDPSAANTDMAPRFQFNVSNIGMPGLDPSLARPTGWMNLPLQAMTYPHEKDTESNLSTGIDFTYFLNLAGEHAWKAGFAYTRASVNKNTLWNAPQVAFTAWRATDGRGTVEIRGGPTSRPSEEFGNQYGEFGIATSNRLAVYLQDSWTIANRFTVNFGLRAESENIPSFNDDPAWAEYIGQSVMKFNLTDKLSPRLGFVYDVLGDSSLKIYGSYGLYNDVMELDMALGSFGGMRWISDIYRLPGTSINLWPTIARLLPDGTRDYSMLTWAGSVDYRAQSWDYVDPEMKPMAQSEVTFGVEKKLREDLSLSVRGVWRNLLRTIDDVGVFVPNASGGFDEIYYITNPGYGYSLNMADGGLMRDDLWGTPKATRDYKALNISLEKRMSNHWMGGLNLTLSRLWGNYTGTVSADEVNQMNTGYGRPDGNVTRYFDVWWMSYDQSGTQKVNNGLLPTDRPVVAKAYGSYAFPFGLTVGAVANFMSGTPKTTEWYVDHVAGYYPLGRGDLGRTPFLWFINLYAEYNLKLGKNTLQISLNVDNATNNATGIWYWTRINWGQETWWDYAARGNALDPDFANLIMNGYDFFSFEGTYPQSMTTWIRDPRFNEPIGFQDPINARLGIKFIF